MYVEKGMEIEQRERGREDDVSSRRSRGLLGSVKLDLPSRLDVLTIARMVVAAAAECVKALEGERLDDLRWVISEALTNAIEANLATDVPGRVMVRVDVYADRVVAEVADQGPGLPPVQPVPDMTEPERLLNEGGFGIPLMQMLTSKPVVFTTGEDGTTVELELHA